jgi:NAD(P)-dependent dehydrogenase (short-subunit alcohol dehydrogenase family)
MADKNNHPDKNADDGAFTSKRISKQEQTLPGTEQDMDPKSESTRLETASGLREYRGVGKLQGKTAIISGGDSGIGRAVGILMAREGVDSTIIYLPEEEEDAQETRKLVEKEGRKCQTLAFDLKKVENVQKVVDKHIQEYGHLDILVNNASQQVECKDFEEIDLETVEKTFRTNILSMFALTKYALPHLKKGSSIINTTSVTAYRGSPAMVDYSSTKGKHIRNH